MTEQPEWMYRTGGYTDKKIERVKVVKLTAKTLIFETTNWRGDICQQTERLRSAYHAIFASWGEAQEWLMAKALDRLASAERSAKRAQQEIETIRGLTDDN